MFDVNLTYLLLIVPALLAWFAQARVRDVYRKHDAQPNGHSMNGLQAAHHLLSYQGLNGVVIEPARGNLTDHYDSRTKTLRLSDGVRNASSVTALGIVAHEVAPAVQDAEGYRLARLRATLSRPVSWPAQMSSFVFVGGVWFGLSSVMVLAGLMLASQAVFGLVTLPVERNASTRALAMLRQTGLATPEESRGAWHVLRAAALTYLTALGRQLATFLFFVMVIGMSRNA